MTEDLSKLVNLLKFRGCSDYTIGNYVSSINKFKNYHEGKDIESFNEDDIVNYLITNFINLGKKPTTVNMNRAAIKYYYIVNFGKKFNDKLLPGCKLDKRYPKVLSNEDIMFLINNTQNLKHKVWLCLGYGSGLRVSEIALLKISDFSYKNKKIRVIGKGNKERFTVFPDYTHEMLLKYYAKYKDKIIASGGYLFPSVRSDFDNEHISIQVIKYFFTGIKKKYSLDSTMTFHTLRHSFATEFIKNGGDIWELKNLLSHSSIDYTMIYIHMANNFNNLCSPIDRNLK